MLDEKNGIIGMAEFKTAVIAAAGGTAAQPQAVFIPSGVIRTFLQEHELPALPARSSLDSAKASVVRLICVRK